MKENDNIENDRLDDFVRKSFDEHEEFPSTGFWTRLESNLPPPPTEPLAGFFGRNAGRLFWAALALLLLAGLAVQHLHFERKIERLERGIQALEQAVRAEKAVEQPDAGPQPSGNILPAENGENRSLKNPGVSGIAKPDRSEVVDNQKIATKNSDSGKAGNLALKNPGGFSNPNFPVADSQILTLENAALAAAPPAEIQTPKTAEIGTEKSPGVLAEPNFPSPTAVETARPKFSETALLPTGLPVLPVRNAGFSAMFLPLTKPVCGPSGFYLDLLVSPGFTFESLENQPLDTHGQPRPALVNAQTGANFNVDFGLRAGQRFGRNFGLETGLSFERRSREAVHRPQFELRHGKKQGGHGGGGGGGPHGNDPKEYDFDYDLETYGGSAAVSLRMEQTDSDLDLPDDERLDFEIQTVEKIEILKIPLLATWRFGKGRLLGNVRAGGQGNFILRNELEIAGASLRDDKFKPRGNDRHEAKFGDFRWFSPGLLVSAGAEYRLTPRLSLLFGPAFETDLKTSRNLGGKPGSCHFSTELTTGLRFNF